MKTMLFNPYTGRPRHPFDISSDPEGILTLDPDELIKAAKHTTKDLVKTAPVALRYENLVAQTIVRHADSFFVVSTINRTSSAVLSYGHKFAETFVFPLDPITGTWGKPLYQFDAPADSMVRHCHAVNELSKNGVINT